MNEQLSMALRMVQFIRPITNKEAWLFIFSLLGFLALSILQATIKTALQPEIGFALCLLWMSLAMVALFFIARSLKRNIID